MAAGFWSKVPRDGSLVATDAASFGNDLIMYSDQTTLVGWQARDSYYRFLSFAQRKFAEHNQVLTPEQFIMYYTSDPSLDLAVIASAVALDATALKQPRYARMSYKLDPTTGMIADFGVHLFSRWTFGSVGVVHPAPSVPYE
jgi:hypothetical protein